MEETTKLKRLGKIRVRANQIEMIVKAMELNPLLNANKLSATYTTAKRNKDWQELSRKLNNSEGAIKSVQCWQKTWVDKKSEVKKRFRILKSARLKTGERKNEETKLSPLEKRIALLIGLDVAEGKDNEDSELMPEVYVIPKTEDCSASATSGSPCIIATLIQNSQSFTQESHQIDFNENLPDTPSRLPDIEESHQFESLPPQSKTPQIKEVNAQKQVKSQTGIGSTLTRCAEALEKYNELQERALEIKKRKADALERGLEIKKQKADAFLEILSLLRTKF